MGVLLWDVLEFRVEDSKGLGSRPLLIRVAAISVCISLMGRRGGAGAGAAGGVGWWGGRCERLDGYQS